MTLSLQLREAQPTFIGIDPGKHGAIAVESPTDVHVFDIPTYRIGPKAVLDYDLPRLRELFQAIGALSPYRPFVTLEKYWGMKDQDVTTTFAQGYGMGVMLGFCGAFGWVPHLVAPISWKSHFQLRGEKGQSPAARKKIALHQARETWPTLTPFLAHEKDTDRADALWLMRYGKEVAWPTQCGATR